MGITGLYKWLGSIKTAEHVKKYAGKTLGIDTYSWLHKGAFSCAVELVQGTPTTRYVDYCVERVKMLQHHGITPYLIFDGDYLPSKAGTEEGREARREDSRQKGLALLGTNKTAAMEILQKAVDVTPLMARHVIEACKALEVPYIVAPYEADAQLYYLERTGVIDGVISEDSDLLVFGVRLLITKMGRSGDCVEVNRENFTLCKDISLAGWTDTEFRTMGILSGCDYLPSIKGIGVKKAHRYVRSHKTVERIVRAIKLDGKMSVPADYLDKFRQAELTFLHQRVWCPTKDAMVMCTEPGEPLVGEALIFIGGEVDTHIARGVALGDLDPITKEPFNLSPGPKYTPKPLSAASLPTTLKKFLQPTMQTRSVATFFSSAASASKRTPLQTRNANVQIIRKAFTAPRLGLASTPLVKKRVISEEAAKTDIPVKKSRLFGPDENVKATGERSSFFQTPNHVQSRRPLGNVDYQSPLPVDSIKRSTSSAAKLPSSATTLGIKKELADLEKAIKASLTTPKPSPAAEKELSDFELAIQKSLSSEYFPPGDLPTKVPVEREDEGTSVQKVARSLKAEFAFKASPPGAAPKKLAKFVERQRVGSNYLGGRLGLQTNVKKTGLLQQLQSGTSAQIPHTVDREDSGESQGNTWDDWPIFEDFEGNQDRSTSASQSQSQSQSQGQGMNAVLGEGGFAKFMLRR